MCGQGFALIAIDGSRPRTYVSVGYEDVHPQWPAVIPGLDPRWEWIGLEADDQPDLIWVRGRCLHLETVPVESSVGGSVLARLCLTCDVQLPPAEGQNAVGT